MLRRRACLFVLCLCMPLALAACEQPQRLPPLSTLHFAGLRHLPGLARIIDSTYTVGVDIAVFQPPDDASLHVVLTDSDHLMVANVDGSGQRQVNPAVRCGSTLAVTPDGKWGTCLGGDTYDETDRLEIVSLVAGSSQRHELRLNSGFYYGPVWSPDGLRLGVVVTNATEAACGIQVYAVGADYASIELVATFTSDVFTASGCDILAVGWSPDGTQLEVAVRLPEALLVDEHVSVTSPTLATSATGTIPDVQFISVADGSPLTIGDAAWNPRTGTLALISSTDGRDGGALRYYPPAAPQVDTWLTMPDSEHFLGRLAWSPDGRSLLLIVTGPYCLDTCITPPPDAYLFTPPAL